MILLEAVAFAFPTPDGRPASVGFVDGPDGRVRCHYEREVDADRCAQVVQWATDAWDDQVDRIGFHAPLPDFGVGGSDALDLYLTREAGGAGSAWVQCSDGYYACLDHDPTDPYLGTPSFVVIDPRTSDVAFEGYVHHEFNHTLQYSYDFLEPFLIAWEGTAVAAEFWTDPEWTSTASNWSQVYDYQATPWLSAVLQDGYLLYDDYDLWSYYEYGGVTWVLWLDQQYGDGQGSIGPALWEAMAQPDEVNEPDLLDAWDALSGDWRASMLDFAIARARLGTDAGMAWTALAGPEAYALREAELAVPAEVTPSQALFPLGTAYFDLDLDPDQPLTVTVRGDPGTEWGLVLVEADADGAVDPTGAQWRPAAAGRGTIGVVNLGPVGMDADDPLVAASFTLTVEAAAAEPLDQEQHRDCGCGSTGGGSGWVGALAFVLVRRGRPRRAERQRASIARRRLAGRRSVQTSAIQARHSALGPDLPTSVQPDGTGRPTAQIEYCSSWLRTTV